MVVFSRWMLWGMVGVMIIAIIWVAAIEGDDGARLVFSSSSGKQAQQNVMEAPRYQGLDKDNQPYIVEADKAVQKDKQTVELFNIKADMNQNDGTWLALNASAGEMTLDEERLYLSGGVQLFYDGGYEFSTEDVHVDIDEGSAYGKNRVEGQGPPGTLQADSFAAKDQGKILEFNGSVRMTLYP